MLSVWAVLAGGCASNAPQDTLKPRGPVARQLDNLFDPVVLIGAVFFFLVQGLVLFAAIRYRARSDEDAPKQIHGHIPLEITWSVVPAIILLFVGIGTVVTILDINRVDASKDVLQVEVIGHQWFWEYRYTESGVVTANELHIPAGRKVQIALKSIDVIHSFWPPALAGKVDVVPGRVNHMVIQADAPGTFLGQCAEFCGLSHSRMRLRVVADSPDDFEQWLREQAAGPDATGGGLAAEGAALFQSRGCAGCHTIKGLSEGKIGPDLTHLMSRETFAGSIFDLNDQNLRKWLRNPQKQKAGNLMKLPVALTEGEITRVIAYLQTLR